MEKEEKIIAAQLPNGKIFQFSTKESGEAIGEKLMACLDLNNEEDYRWFKEFQAECSKILFKGTHRLHRRLHRNFRRVAGKPDEN